MTTARLQEHHLADLSGKPTTLPPTPIAFLRSWFSACPPDQLLELRAILFGDHSIRQDFFTLDATPELYWRACELVDGYDVYFGVCPRIRPRGDKASVMHASGLWADLDFKRFPDGEARALRKLGQFLADWQANGAPAELAYLVARLQHIAHTGAYRKQIDEIIGQLKALPVAS